MKYKKFVHKLILFNYHAIRESRTRDNIFFHQHYNTSSMWNVFDIYVNKKKKKHIFTKFLKSISSKSKYVFFFLSTRILSLFFFFLNPQSCVRLTNCSLFMLGTIRHADKRFKPSKITSKVRLTRFTVYECVYPTNFRIVLSGTPTT